jgi:hypothetical protein
VVGFQLSPVREINDNISALYDWEQAAWWLSEGHRLSDKGFNVSFVFGDAL